MAYPTNPALADIRNDGRRHIRPCVLAGLALLLATAAVAAPLVSAPQARSGPARGGAGVKLGPVVYGKVAVDPKGLSR